MKSIFAIKTDHNETKIWTNDSLINAFQYLFVGYGQRTSNLTHMVFVFSKLKRSFPDHMQNESSVRI